MNKLLRLLVVFFILSSVIFADDSHKKKSRHYGLNCLEDVNIDIEGSTLVISPEYDHDFAVEITKDYRLYVNGRRINTNSRQQDLVQQYYDTFFNIVESAKDIGLEGAKIGLKGAKIGMQAVLGVLKLMDEDYDSEDLEAEIEAEAQKLEEEAKDLEKFAEEIEYLAEDFEDIHYSLKEEVPELNELDWF